ncbi:hypothetical protein [Streptomyces sp. NPDC058308]|uniref:hypothetical protein n=1 Tax=Streptomyces sp. NPDC058308 TaxID=3346440 RepID=UPI0036E254D3
MGIESDQLVYDYLSRVGDLAQQRQLPSGDRMRLVAELRHTIERGRAKAVGDSPAGVRRILDRLGTPEEVVDAAGGAPGDVPAKPRAPRPSVPVQRTGRPRARREPTESREEPGERDEHGGRDLRQGRGGGGGAEGGPGRLRRVVPRPRPRPRPRRTAPAPLDPAEFDGSVPSPPHLAGSDELGPSGSAPDWWRVDSSPFGVADSVPGFVGGVEIPELLKPPPSLDKAKGKGRHADGDEGEEEGEYEEEYQEEYEAEEEEAAEGRRRRWRLPRGRAVAAGTGATFSNPLLLLAAALLTVGAILGNLLALGVGWLIAYASRRLSRAEAKFAALGLPALAVAAGIGWLWGRGEGRWGEPIRDGHLSDALADTWPWVVRGAAVASALFLLWRSQRQRQ